MDKETLIRLAQPAATALLAVSIISIPLIATAGQTIWGSSTFPIYVRHQNSCS